MLITSRGAWADFEFGDLDASDIDDINRDFSALMAHTTVSPATGLLDAGGFEFGIIGGILTLPHVRDLVAEQNPDEDVYKMIHAGIIGLYSWSKTTTVEAKWIPDIGSRSDGAFIGSQSVAVKFSTTEPKAGPPVYVALRGQLTNSYLRTQQVVNNSSTGNTDVTVNFKFSSISLGASALAGYKFNIFNVLLIEPYAGLGAIHARSRFVTEADSAASIFLSGSSSENSSQTGVLFYTGFQLHSYFTKFGFEYSRIFDSHKFTGKIAFGY